MRASRFIVLLAVAMLVPAAAWAFTPGAGLAGTPHDFSASGGGVGLCTFCHTPHRAIQTQLLWNHTLSTNTFQWDVPSTTAGTPYPSFKGDVYTGPTAKCLSCHDGSVAVGDIAWWNEGVPSNLNNTQHQWPDAFNVGATGGVAGSMKGNHPVAMPYPFGQARNTYNTIQTGTQYTSTEWQADPQTLNIRLYNDNGGVITAGAVALQTGMECSSCHDAHNKASTGDMFLRGTLAGSDTGYICLKCHIK